METDRQQLEPIPAQTSPFHQGCLRGTPTCCFLSRQKPGNTDFFVIAFFLFPFPDKPDSKEMLETYLICTLRVYPERWVHDYGSR